MKILSILWDKIFIIFEIIILKHVFYKIVITIKWHIRILKWSHTSFIHGFYPLYLKHLDSTEEYPSFIYLFIKKFFDHTTWHAES